MNEILDLGIEFIRFLQAAGAPTLNPLFKALTFLGDELFFVITFPIFWFGFGWKIAARLSIAFLISTALNSELKMLFELPRPFTDHPEIQLIGSSGFSFPSGHAQGATVFWGILALSFTKRTFTHFCILLIFLIGLSRVYLGVHYPTDVLAGWAVGGLFLLAYYYSRKAIERWLNSVSQFVHLLIGVGIPVFITLVFPTPTYAAIFGAISGNIVGLAISNYGAPEKIKRTPQTRIIFSIIGIMGTIVLYNGLKSIFPSNFNDEYFLLFRFIRYALIGVWLSYGSFVLNSFYIKKKTTKKLSKNLPK